MIKNSKRIIFILIILILIITFLLYYVKMNNKEIFFALYGKEEITLYEGDKYQELGFIAKDKKNNNIEDQVIITSDLDSNKIGTYYINYSIKTKFKTHTLTRKINVLEDPFKDVDFYLIGNKIVNISLNEEFNDPLYFLKGSNNQDLSQYVKIETNLNNQMVGHYEINYILEINGKQKILTRNINVLEKEYSVLLSNENKTNQDITIDFTSHIPNFAYVINPNNEKKLENNTQYVVKENGIYKFIVYDNEDSYKEYNVEIKNIDKEKPKIISCSSYIENKQTTFIINTNDSDIKNYVINDQAFDSNTFKINGTIENGTVYVYDYHNNYETINCNAFYKEINPKGNETVIHTLSTDTLKLWIEKNDRCSRTDYFTTHIWVKDAYNQFKTQVPNRFGNETAYPSNLVKNASNIIGREKSIIAINASFFIINDVFDDNKYEVNHKLNYTAGIPLVISNGKVLRDLANENIPSLYITGGLKKDGNLGYYRYSSGNRLPSNIETSKRIINDGVRNTFGFSALLVDNYAKSSTNTLKNIRQGFCQIDKNNFVFITDILSNQQDGFSFSELADKMISLDCKTGFNMDGGGSVALILKKNSSEPIKISGNNRGVADIVYFHE